MFRRKLWLSVGTSARQAPRPSDSVFAEVGHVVHAAEHAAIRGLGDQQFFCPKIAESPLRKGLSEQLPLDQVGD